MQTPRQMTGRRLWTALPTLANFTISQQIIAAGGDTAKSHTFKKVLSNHREYAGEMTQTQPRSPPSSKSGQFALSDLGRASLQGDVEKAKRILKPTSSGLSRFNVDEGSESGLSAFFLASMHGHFEIMSYLLETRGKHKRHFQARVDSPHAGGQEKGRGVCVISPLSGRRRQPPIAGQVDCIRRSHKKRIHSHNESAPRSWG